MDNKYPKTLLLNLKLLLYKKITNKTFFHVNSEIFIANSFFIMKFWKELWIQLIQHSSDFTQVKIFSFFPLWNKIKHHPFLYIISFNSVAAPSLINLWQHCSRRQGNHEKVLWTCQIQGMQAIILSCPNTYEP